MESTGYVNDLSSAFIIVHSIPQTHWVAKVWSQNAGDEYVEPSASERAQLLQAKFALASGPWASLMTL